MTYAANTGFSSRRHSHMHVHDKPARRLASTFLWLGLRLRLLPIAPEFLADDTGVMQRGLSSRAGASRKTRIPVRIVDAILADAGNAVDEVDLACIDIEGYERVVCLSLARLIQKNLPVGTMRSPGMVGREAGASLLRLLAGYCAHCVLLDGRSARPIPVSAIPLDQGRIRLLLVD